MPRPEPSERVELKYCEGCGGLQVRPVGSGLTFCLRCEAKQAEESIFVAPKQKHPRRGPRLPRRLRIDLRACADPRVYSAVEVCA
jgi:hypothetical protein